MGVLPRRRCATRVAAKVTLQSFAPTTSAEVVAVEATPEEEADMSAEVVMLAEVAMQLPLTTTHTAEDRLLALQEQFLEAKVPLASSATSSDIWLEIASHLKRSERAR